MNKFLRMLRMLSPQYRSEGRFVYESMVEVCCACARADFFRKNPDRHLELSIFDQRDVIKDTWSHIVSAMSHKNAKNVDWFTDISYHFRIYECIDRQSFWYYRILNVEEVPIGMMRYCGVLYINGFKVYIDPAIEGWKVRYPDIGDRVTYISTKKPRWYRFWHIDDEYQIGQV